jgi:hypothetical protein
VVCYRNTLEYETWKQNGTKNHGKRWKKREKEKRPGRWATESSDETKLDHELDFVVFYFLFRVSSTILIIKGVRGYGRELSRWENPTRAIQPRIPHSAHPKPTRTKPNHTKTQNRLIPPLARTLEPQALR